MGSLTHIIAIISCNMKLTFEPPFHGQHSYHTAQHKLQKCVRVTILTNFESNRIAFYNTFSLCLHTCNTNVVQLSCNNFTTHYEYFKTCWIL